MHRSFLSYVAVVAHVAVGNDGQVTIPRLDMAIDCGTIVNPDRVRAQMEGAAIMAIGNALYSDITFKNGSVEQSNYTDYLVARIDITPETHVHFVENDASAERCRRARRAAHRAGDLQRDLRSHRQTHQGAAGRSAAVEGLALQLHLSFCAHCKCNVLSIIAALYASMQGKLALKYV